VRSDGIPNGGGQLSYLGILRLRLGFGLGFGLVSILPVNAVNAVATLKDHLLGSFQALAKDVGLWVVCACLLIRL